MLRHSVNVMSWRNVDGGLALHVHFESAPWQRTRPAASTSVGGLLPLALYISAQ